MSLTVVRATGLVTVQDLGRPGHMHVALAPGGALVPELLVNANRAASNPDGAAALEVLGSLLVVAETELVVAVEHPRLLRPGEAFEVISEPRRVAYLAIRGGIDAPLVLGSRATQLSAGIGARVRKDDRFTAARAPEVVALGEPFLDSDVVEVIPGPDHDAFAPDALDQLVSAPYRINPSSDRIGTILDGPVVPWVAGHEQVSRPMTRGAIEVLATGMPVVLGPEHPTTGGYPVIAVVAHADLGRLFANRLGGTVRFEIRPTRGN